MMDSGNIAGVMAINLDGDLCGKYEGSAGEFVLFSFMAQHHFALTADSSCSEDLPGVLTARLPRGRVAVKASSCSGHASSLHYHCVQRTLKASSILALLI